MGVIIIPEHNYTVREKTVVNLLAQHGSLFKTFLNVGFHNWEDPRRHWWIKICEANGWDWQIMEIYEPNVKDAIAKGCPEDKIFLGDITNTEKYGDYDCILFWHGPEHLKKEKFLEALPKIEALTNRLLIFGMPLGHEPQGDAYGNPFERHESDWYEHEWKKLGYETIPVHDHQKYPHITTYKRTS
jgi:hypothetical protein